MHSVYWYYNYTCIVILYCMFMILKYTIPILYSHVSILNTHGIWPSVQINACVWRSHSGIDLYYTAHTATFKCPITGLSSTERFGLERLHCTCI